MLTKTENISPRCPFFGFNLDNENGGAHSSASNTSLWLCRRNDGGYEVRSISQTYYHGRHELTCIVNRKPEQDEPKPTKMDPDRTYITVLPGHSKPAFIRKRRHYRGNPFGLTAIARALAPAPRRRRSYSVEHVVRMRSSSPTYIRAYPPPPPLRHYQTVSQPTVVTQEIVHSYPRLMQYSPPMLEQRVVSDSATAKVMAHNGRVEKSISQHTCSSCGKYRSASYQSRHPLAPGELPKPGTCRRCIREHTSSENSEEEARRWRRVSSHEEGHKRYLSSQKRHRNDADSTTTYLTSSPSKEEIRVIHQTRLVGRNQRRSRSASKDSTRICVTIEPEHIGRSRRRRSIEPVNDFEHTRYVEQRSRSQSRSQSRSRSRSRSNGSTLFDYEPPVSVRVRRNDYGQTSRGMVAESYQPREMRTIEYGYDGDLTREAGYKSPVIRRNSASSLVQHSVPYRVEKKEVKERRERSSSPRFAGFRRGTEEAYTSRSFNRRSLQRPTNSVRILRVSRDAENQPETRRVEMPALQRRVSFVEQRSPIRSPTMRQFIETAEPEMIYHRQEVHRTEVEGSGETAFRGMTNLFVIIVHVS